MTPPNPRDSNRPKLRLVEREPEKPLFRPPSKMWAWAIPLAALSWGGVYAIVKGIQWLITTLRSTF